MDHPALRLECDPVRVLDLLLRLSRGRARLFGKLNWIEFFTSTQLAAHSEVQPRYGTLALAGRHGVGHGVGDGAGGAAGARRGRVHLRVLRRQVKETLKILIELLAAIPSIVWGFVGYMVLGPI